MAKIDDQIHNERIKLTATFLNGLAVAIFAVGGLAPTISIAAGQAALADKPVVLGLAIFCYILPGALHLASRRALKDMRNVDD